VAPFLASTADYCFSKRSWNMAGKISIGVLAYCASIWVTIHAYHVKNAYRALPSVDDFLLVGLGWAFIATVPSLIAVSVRKPDFSAALVIGALTSLLSLVFLTPLNIGLMIMLSFE
jgi:hypothetical protein